MLKELAALWDKLEDQRQRMLAMIEDLPTDQLQFALSTDRWSILQVIQHVVQGETGGGPHSLDSFLPRISSKAAG